MVTAIKVKHQTVKGIYFTTPQNMFILLAQHFQFPIYFTNFVVTLTFKLVTYWTWTATTALLVNFLRF